LKVRLNDKVVKNPETWAPDPDADLYGRGAGVGIAKSVDVAAGTAEIQWPSGLHTELVDGLSKVQTDDPMEKWIDMSSGPYFVIPATVIRHMPKEWQEKLAEMIGEAEDRFDWVPPHNAKYKVMSCRHIGGASGLRTVNPLRFEKKAQPS
jgi:hypothetical protein